MNNTFDFFGLVMFIILGMALIILAIVSVLDVNYEGREVDCFDRYGNKIIGLECYKDPPSISEVIGGSIILTISGIFMFFAGFLVWNWRSI